MSLLNPYHLLWASALPIISLDAVRLNEGDFLHCWLKETIDEQDRVRSSPIASLVQFQGKQLE